MTDVPKTRQQVLADPNAFDAAYARAKEQFKRFPGVVGVGIGQKHQAGRYLDNISIVVYVNEKKPAEQVPAAERIPSAFEGYPTDVQVVPTASSLACDNDTKYERIRGGIQITGNAFVVPGNPPKASFDSGTLGCIVKKRSDTGRENVYLLTNKHVLFRINVTGPGDHAFHPYPPAPPAQDGKEFPLKEGKALGPIQPASFFENVSFPIPDPNNPGVMNPTPYFIDSCLVRFELDSTWCGTTCEDHYKYDPEIIDLQVNGLNTIADVNDIRFGLPAKDIIGKQVFKVGVITGRTVGIVRAIDTPVLITPEPALGTGQFTGENMVGIELDTSVAALNCHGNPFFAEHGDSGSLIVDAQGRAIALLARGQVQPPQPNDPPPRTFGCHIVPVLDTLNICIQCATGTSHGSSRAIDGSGVAPGATLPQDSKLPDGKIVFSGGAAETLPGLPRPLSDDEAARIRARLAVFLETPRGPELRGAFARVRREVGYLVRNVKQVTVAWHKHRGPAFLAYALNHLSGETDRIPRETDGITRQALLLRMREVLHKYGSHPLQEVLDTYGDEILAMSERCDTLGECMDYLEMRERV